MKKLIVLVLCLLCVGTIYTQSRRVAPATSNTRANTRTPTPTPTPAAKSEEGIQDTGDFESVKTELVTVPVRVLDRNNRFVGGLAKENFKIFEDGVEQDIAYFTNEAQPFTVALVLDMSYSTVFKISEIQSAAIAFIDQLRPQDKVLVVSFDEEVHMLTEATSDRGRIYRAIRSTHIATGTSLYDAVDLTMNERLRSIKGRKAIVLFTDGVDTTSRRSYDLKNLGDARELDALIYPIRYDTFADVQSMKNKTIITFPGPKAPTGQGNPIPASIPTGPVSPNDKGTTAAEYAAAEEYLNQLALNTGGRIYLASTTGSLNKAFSSIASELREFYSIGFEPKGEPIPGKTRKIKVRTDRQGVVIRARDSYTVPKRRKAFTE
jgi:Ca-activated chloride channel family protein